jgi:hypothetical protein
MVATSVSKTCETVIWESESLGVGRPRRVAHLRAGLALGET